jgi:hypothetical protein
MGGEATLELFFDRLAAVNPFLENRVNGPAPTGADAAGVHLQPFERLTGLAQQALAARCGLGAVLWGEAGIGKSHLLARLDRWAAQTGATFVYLHNLQAAPAALPRSLLHAVVTRLTAGRSSRFAAVRLFGLVRAGVVEAVGQVGRFAPELLRSAFGLWLDRLGPAAGDRLVYEVLFAFFLSAAQERPGQGDGSLARLAVRWLAGGALDPAEARLLGLPPGLRRDEPVALGDAQEIKQVLAALSRLALAEGKPFVLALDQVDNLDQEQFAALTRFLEALLDTAVNLLVVTAGVSTTLSDWRQAGVVQTSAWDRVAQTEVRLTRLQPDQAGQLVRARLDHFFAPFAAVDPVARLRTADPLFPLGSGWAEKTLAGQIELRPRDVVSLAREGWAQQQARLRELGPQAWLAGWAGGGTEKKEEWTAGQRQQAVERAVEEEMEALRQQALAGPGGPPSDADHLAGVLYDVLLRFCEPGYDLLAVTRIEPPRRGAAPAYHLSLRRRAEAGEAVTGVLVLAEKGATSVTGFLRRLLQNSQPLDRLVVVADERTGLPRGDKGQEYLDELRARGPGRFLTVTLGVAAQAELAALAAVLARARAGEVEVRPPGEPAAKVSAAQAAATAAWRQQALAHPLVRELVAPAGELAALAQ